MGSGQSSNQTSNKLSNQQTNKKSQITKTKSLQKSINDSKKSSSRSSLIVQSQIQNNNTSQENKTNPNNNLTKLKIKSVKKIPTSSLEIRNDDLFVLEMKNPQNSRMSLDKNGHKSSIKLTQTKQKDQFYDTDDSNIHKSRYQKVQKQKTQYVDLLRKYNLLKK